jgi:glucose-1-phosphatase
MARAEGWTSNTKWKNMPEQMLGYRAASFFARLYCPDAMMGFQTIEEVEDVSGNSRPKGAAQRLAAALKADTLPTSEQTNSVADALVLQCYESENMAAFGHELTEDQWRAICGIKEVYDALLFTTHSAAVNLAYPLVSRIREELANGNRKFTFLCGHDSNLASISSALRLNLPETEQALEVRTPIGSKLVFEKWSDGSDDYVAINLVYPKYRQMHARALLSPGEPPMVQPVTIEGLTANSDGLYRLADLDGRMAGAMAEYDAIEDAPTAMPSAVRTVTTSEGRSYTLSGTPANASTRGIVIRNDKKIISSK